MLMVWTMRQDQSFQQARATVQALMLMLDDQKATEIMKKTFADLRQAYFPYDKRIHAQESHELKKILAKEISKGVISIAPVQMPKRNKWKGPNAESHPLRRPQSTTY